VAFRDVRSNDVRGLLVSLMEGYLVWQMVHVASSPGTLKHPDCIQDGERHRTLKEDDFEAIEEAGVLRNVATLEPRWGGSCHIIITAMGILQRTAADTFTIRRCKYSVPC
jgi:hypothetical protein